VKAAGETAVDETADSSLASMECQDPFVTGNPVMAG